MSEKLIEFLGTFPPRECGIATFSTDLVNCIQKAAGDTFSCRVAAMNANSCSTYNYPKIVNLQIDEDELETYMEAAEYINKNKKIKAVCIQHEFGIFGGDMGSYILPFLDELKKPVITTFHSVLPGDPLLEKRRVHIVKRICENSERVIVISGFGKDILQEKYGVDADKIVPIPHGVPSIPFRNQKSAKKTLGLEGRTVISTFGLMSKRKGLQYVIRAMPHIVEKHPEVLYIGIGETHPVVRKHEGETYRKKLSKLVKKLGLRDNVRFYNKFLPIKELCTYLEATDIYITPYYDPQQISSGTLAYAIGAGKACISTPYLYAQDALRDDRGVFVKYKAPKDVANKVNMLIENPATRRRIEANAYAYSRGWQWNKIGKAYLNLFNEITG
jgi:glycosyltransferase involved in cell wall biosynthesis